MNDCLSCVFNYLPLSDIVNCFPVCKQYNNVANNNVCWKILLANNFDYKSFDSNYKEKYRQYCALNKYLLCMPEIDIDGIHSKIIKRDFNYVKTDDHILLSINYIPPEIGLLTHLTTIFAKHNKIQSLPIEIGLLTKLTRLVLCKNLLQSIPEEIGLLTRLSNLNLSANQLQELPKEIGLLTNLCDLELSDNLLASLPKEIELLTRLTHLNIGRNKIEFLPEETQSLTNLRVLTHSYIW